MYSVCKWALVCGFGWRSWYWGVSIDEVSVAEVSLELEVTLGLVELEVFVPELFALWQPRACMSACVMAVTLLLTASVHAR